MPFRMFSQNEKAAQRKKEPRKRPPNTAKQLAKLERDIAAAEERLNELDAMAQENGSDYQKLMELEAEKTEKSQELEALYARWEEPAE